MGKFLALAVVAVLVAATYWRPLRQLRTALGLDHLLSTGHAFLLVGYLLGLVFGGSPGPLADEIGPIIAVVGGWIGFAAGMRFDFRVLRTVPGEVYTRAMLPAVGALLAVVGTTAVVLHQLGEPLSRLLPASLLLGAVAASSGPTLVAVLRSRRAGRSPQARPILRMIEFSAGVDDIVVVLAGIVVFALFQPGPEHAHPATLLALALGGGALLGVITWLLLGGRATEDERLLLGLAMLTFTAGFAGWLRLSPAAVAAVTAIVLVNLPGERMARLLAAVRRVERPAVVILMTVLGFYLSGPMTWALLPLVAVMTVVRLMAKRVLAPGQPQPFGSAPGLHASPGWAYGLAPQGTLGVMVALNFFHVWEDDLARTMLGAVAIASVVNEAAAPWLVLRLLKASSLPEPDTTIPPTNPPEAPV